MKVRRTGPSTAAWLLLLRPTCNKGAVRENGRGDQKIAFRVLGDAEDADCCRR